MLDKKVVVTSRSFSRNPELRSYASKKFKEVKFNDDQRVLSGGELIRFVDGFEGLIVALEPFGAEEFSRLAKLEVLSKYGVGLDNLDLKELERNNIIMGWAGGVNKRSVAELVMGFALGISRNIFSSMNSLKQGLWQSVGGCEISGKKVGIIGFGHVGRDVAHLFSAFGCEVLVNDVLPYESDCINLGYRWASKEEIYSLVDIISLHIPLDTSTRSLISVAEFSAMKRDTILINTARGGIVDEASLYDALLNKKIGAAAFDVFLEEPAVDNPLLELSNFYGTPHIGGSSKEAILSMGYSAVDKLYDGFMSRF